MTQKLEIRCARCNVILKGPAEPDPKDIIVCPICGESAEYETVIREVEEYIKDMTFKQIKLRAADTFKNTPGITVRGEDLPEKTYRFIAPGFDFWHS